MPLISVNMPAYNAGRHIAAAIESVLAQTLDDLEVVVVDDGSADDTAAIVGRLRDSDPRVRLMSRPNTGVVGARNDALRASVGEFIAVLDSDDIARPDRLERQIDHLREHPDCLAVGSPALVIDNDGDPLACWFPPLPPDLIDEVNLAGDRAAALCHSSVTMRREAVLRVGGYREPYATAEDLDLWLRLAEVGRLASLDEALVEYRMHPANIGATQARRQRAAAEAAIADARRRRGLPPADPRPPMREAIPADPAESYGWMALGAGHSATARKYARARLARRPLSLSSWRFLYCALRGH
jgi:glycosyltransferase involved in cell wall biosynthesis